MQAAIFLDRDDTLIHNGGDLGDPNAVRLIQGAAAAIGSLRGLGYRIVVVTNQGGVARGKYGEEDVDAVHERINELVRATASGASIDRFYYCPYHPEGTVEKYKREHPWRKPQPGMLLQAAKDLQLDLEQCWMIGDQMRDIEAGAAAGVRTILVQGEERVEKRGTEAPSVTPHFIARSLVEAVRIVAQQRKPEIGEEFRSDEGGKKWSPGVVAEAVQRKREEGTRPSGSGPMSAKAADGPRPARPFRPWNAPVTEGGTEVRESKPVSEPVQLKLHSPVESSPDSPLKFAEPESEVEQPSSVSPDRIPLSRQEQESSANASMHATLRQILQELRNQRSAIQDFSVLGYLAIVLQLVAALCLIAAFLMGPYEEGVFFKWLGTGLFIQLAVIAVLMFDRE